MLLLTGSSPPPPPLKPPSLPMNVSLPKRTDWRGRRGRDQDDRYDDRKRVRHWDSPPTQRRDYVNYDNPQRLDYHDDRYYACSTSATTSFHQFSAPAEPTKPRGSIVERITVTQPITERITVAHPITERVTVAHRR